MQNLSETDSLLDETDLDIDANVLERIAADGSLAQQLLKPRVVSGMLAFAAQAVLSANKRGPGKGKELLKVAMRYKVKAQTPRQRNEVVGKPMPTVSPSQLSQQSRKSSLEKTSSHLPPANPIAGLAREKSQKTIYSSADADRKARQEQHASALIIREAIQLLEDDDGSQVDTLVDQLHTRFAEHSHKLGPFFEQVNQDVQKAAQRALHAIEMRESHDRLPLKREEHSSATLGEVGRHLGFIKAHKGNNKFFIRSVTVFEQFDEKDAKITWKSDAPDGLEVGSWITFAVEHAFPDEENWSWAYKVESLESD